jgi:hypothetical protein
MTRKLIAAALFGFVISAPGSADDGKSPGDAKPGKPAGKEAGFDKGKMFAQMDANADGKLTKDEIVRYFDQVRERMKAKGKDGETPDRAAIDKKFAKMDADGDGYVSRDEFGKGIRPGSNDGKKKSVPDGE